MKNFPNQFSNLDTFSRGLQVFADVYELGGSLHDEELVGDALARADVYKFRGSRGAGAEVERLLLQERQKPAGSRGTRTMARELRRTFQAIGLLSDDDDLCAPTSEATRLLGLRGGLSSPQAIPLWSEAFHSLAVGEGREISHPYALMLRLVAERPGLEKPLLGLALEPHDDSEQEFRRLLELVDKHGDRSAWARIGASRATRDNSHKVLPSVARQLGELRIEKGRAYLSSGVESPSAVSGGVRTHGQGKPPAWRSFKRGRGRNRQRSGELTVALYDPDRVGERTEQHEACLDAFDALLPPDCKRWEGRFDLLVAAGNELLLTEVKTIRMDAAIQVRRALGQLLYYEFFVVRPRAPKARVHRLLVTDAVLYEEYVRFLASHEVGVIAHEGREWHPSPLARRQLARFSLRL